jgi:hypothetical protein
VDLGIRALREVRISPARAALAARCFFDQLERACTANESGGTVASTEKCLPWVRSGHSTPIIPASALRQKRTFLRAYCRWALMRRQGRSAEFGVRLPSFLAIF